MEPQMNFILSFSLFPIVVTNNVKSIREMSKMYLVVYSFISKSGRHGLELMVDK